MTSVEEAFEKKLKTAVIPFGDYELKFEYSDFGDDYEERARNELRETPENIANGLTELRKLLKNEVNLRIPDDEEFLRVFLRPCKYYPESAFQMIRRYYKFRLKHPKYYENLMPSNEKAAFNQNLLTIVPLRNKNGERVLIIEAGRKWNPKSCSLNNLVRSVILILEAAVAEARTQVSGAHVILDMDGLSLQHVWQFTPSFAKDIVGFVEDCIPLRLKGVHIVFQPYVFNMLFAIFKPFLGEKLRNRIHFHGTNFASLQCHLDKSILPKKYEGTCNIPMEEGEKLHSYLTNFEPEFKMKAHEGYMDENH